MLAHVDPFEGDLWESYKIWQTDSAPLTNKRLFSCDTKNRCFFNKCLRSPWQLQEQLQQCWRGLQRTWTLSDWSTRWDCSLWYHSGRFLQVSHSFWTCTWPGSTSSKVAPWVARTAPAMASITCREDKNIKLVGNDTMSLVIEQEFHRQNPWALEVSKCFW